MTRTMAHSSSFEEKKHFFQLNRKPVLNKSSPESSRGNFPVTKSEKFQRDYITHQRAEIVNLWPLAKILKDRAPQIFLQDRSINYG